MFKMRPVTDVSLKVYVKEKKSPKPKFINGKSKPGTQWLLLVRNHVPARRGILPPCAARVLDPAHTLALRARL